MSIYIPKKQKAEIESLIKECEHKISSLLGKNILVKVKMGIAEGDIEKLKALVATHFNLSWGTIMGSSQGRDVLNARHSFAWLCREYLGMGYVNIGRLIGKHYSSAMNSKRVIDNLLKTKDADIEKGLLPIIEILHG